MNPYIGVLNLQPERQSTETGPSPANVRLITINCRQTLDNKEETALDCTILQGKMHDRKT